MHLSEQNNTEDLALNEINNVFKEYNINFKDIKCAKQNQITEVVSI